MDHIPSASFCAPTERAHSDEFNDTRNTPLADWNSETTRAGYTIYLLNPKPYNRYCLQ